MLEALSRAVLGRAERLSGMLEDAEHTFADLIERSQATSQPALVAWACHLLAQVQQARGNLGGAGRTYQRAHDLAAESEQTAPLPGAIANLGLAEVAYQRAELDDAIDHINLGVALCRRTANPTLVASGLATRAWILQARGDPAGARDAIDEAADIGLGAEIVDLVNPVPARRAKLLLVQGDLDGAAAWTDERGLSAGDDPPYAREPAYLALARVLRAQGRAAEALGLLERLHVTAARQGRLGSVIEIQALQALANADRGDDERAASLLTGALARAQPQEYVRVFADEGADMGMLLRRLLATRQAVESDGGGVPAPYLQRLIAAIEPAGERLPDEPVHRSRRVLVPGLVEGLTEREMEVLRLLAAGKPNREIADELFVTLHTVKKHITHILDKLGATNRTEAAARARDLGLIE
jgi:LuxR family maltose regulon positive regulatory protein